MVEKRKGDVIYTRSTQGDVYFKVGTKYPLYKIKPPGYGEDAFQIIRFDKPDKDVRWGHPNETVVIKNVTRKWAEQWVLHKLDPANHPKPKGRDESREMFTISKRAVVETDIETLLQKYSEPRKGIDLAGMEHRSVLLFEGQKNKVVSDGFVLLYSKKAADEILGKHIEKLRKKEAARILKLGILSKVDADKAADNWVATQRGGRFPDWKKLIPEDRVETWTVVGTSTVGSSQAAWLTNGDGKFVAVPIDALGLIHQYVPGAKITSAKFRASTTSFSAGTASGVSKDVHTSPLAFEKNGEVKALLMPLLASSIPAKIRDAGKPSVKASTKISELRDLHDDRSDLSKSSDERQEHSVIIEPDDPRTATWIRDPGRMDVRGVDTPNKSKHRTPKRRKSSHRRPDTTIKSIRR